jgi:hypothetical protein
MLEIISLITGERLQVAENDLEKQMTWDQAKDACMNLGDGWRLPTKSELQLMYNELHKNGRGDFKIESYWCSTQYDESGAWCFYFANINGDAYGDDKRFAHYVRAVRTLQT